MFFSIMSIVNIYTISYETWSDSKRKAYIKVISCGSVLTRTKNIGSQVLSTQFI